MRNDPIPLPHPLFRIVSRSMMDLCKQDTGDPTPSLPLPDSGVGRERWCPCGLIHSTLIILFPCGRPNDGPDIEVEAKGL